jgi:hypothetical protein
VRVLPDGTQLLGQVSLFRLREIGTPVLMGLPKCLTFHQKISRNGMTTAKGSRARLHPYLLLAGKRGLMKRAGDRAYPRDVPGDNQELSAS